MTSFQTLFWSFPAATQKGGLEELRALRCTENKKGSSVRQVVVKACSGDWGGPADRNPARKAGPLPLEQKFQCLASNQKACDLCVEKKFRGEDKAEHAQERCRGVGGNMAKIETKGGARVQAVSFTGRKKVVVTKREKERDGTVRASNPRPS